MANVDCSEAYQALEDFGLEDGPANDALDEFLEAGSLSAAQVEALANLIRVIGEEI